MAAKGVKAYGAIAVKQEIDSILGSLIDCGLCIFQNFTSINKIEGGFTTVDWGNTQDLSISMKNIDYEDIYKILDKKNNYTIKMIDGALIQMMYTFDQNDNIYSHRLSYFPCINLYPLDNYEELYTKFDEYADILKKNTLPTIFRFDFSRDEKMFIEVDHAMSHLTFGQYENCRIPLVGPLSPRRFIDFVIRNFYHKAMKDFNLNFSNGIVFDKTLTQLEESLIHLNFV